MDLLKQQQEKRRALMTNGERVGEVTHFFGKISVAVVKLTNELNVGDNVHFLGRNTDFQQEVASMQVEHEAISVAEAGSEVAIKTTSRVRRGDAVFLLTPEE
jgi:translation elongation factor EF-1alpha